MKKAFTLIELIFIMVVVAILATYSIPRFKKDTRIDAIRHILTAIRYTQYLALHDSKHLRFDSRWQRAYWQFRVESCANNSGLFYIIATDSSSNRNSTLNANITKAETAMDPSNGKYTYWDKTKECPTSKSFDNLNKKISPNIFLTQKYGIDRVQFNCNVYENGIINSTKNYIGFDNFGRVHMDYDENNNNTAIPHHWGYAVNNCTITFNFKDSSIAPFTIAIENETGYAHLQ